MEMTMDRFESMSVFVAVAEAHGFSAAARRLRIPLATVSRKVSELEELLKVRLINLSTRQITLTESGRVYFESARRILETLGEAERAASGEYRIPRGALTITAPIVFGRLHILPVVVEFLRAYPEVEIKLLLVDRLVELLEEDVDLAVRISELPDSSLIAARLGSIGFVVCASPAYLAARGYPGRPEDLADHDCVTATTSPTARLWSFKIGKSVREVPVRSRLSTTTAEAAIDAAIAGAGLTQVRGYQVVEAIKAGRLERVLRDYEPDPAPLSFVYPSGRLMPRKLQAFLEFAVPRVKARLPAI
jgi:DNA-binding transcriptional LysR family regulator